MRIGFMNIHGKDINTLTKSDFNKVLDTRPEVLIFAEAADSDLKTGSDVKFGNYVYEVVKKETRENKNSGKVSDTMIFLCVPELFGKYVNRLDLARKIRVGNFTVEGIHWASPNWKKGAKEEEIFKSLDDCMNYHIKSDAQIKIGDFNLDLCLLNDPNNANKEFTKFEYKRVKQSVEKFQVLRFNLLRGKTPTYKDLKTAAQKELDYAWINKNTGTNFTFNSTEVISGFDHAYIELNYISNMDDQIKKPSGSNKDYYITQEQYHEIIRKALGSETTKEKAIALADNFYDKALAKEILGYKIVENGYGYNMNFLHDWENYPNGEKEGDINREQNREYFIDELKEMGIKINE